MIERTVKPAWPRWWYGVVALACIAALILIMCAGPSEARAGWFDFIGDAAVAVSDATWKVALIRALERTLPSLILLTCIVGAIGSGWGAGVLAVRWQETARTALRDDKVTVGEWVVLAAGTLIVLPISAGLLWFAWFLTTAARSGLLELMR